MRASRPAPSSLLLLLTLLSFVVGPLPSAWAQSGASAAASTSSKRWAESESTKRVALVIGNAAYQFGSPLKNPLNDADRMAEALGRLGFKVILLKDGTNRQMVEAISSFGDELTNDCVAFAYYSGHGMQVDGVNYLLPVDFHAKKRAEVPFEGVAAGRLLAQFEEAKSPVNIVVLDACRNNPFRSFSRANEGGLTKMEAPKGTLIAYATAPGSVADDNSEGANGLYTTELLKELPKPGIKIEDMFKQVLDGVATASGEKQLPWIESSIRGNLFLVKGSAGEALGGSSEEVNTRARLLVTSNAPNAVVKIGGRSVAGGTYVVNLLEEAKRTVEVLVTAPGYEGKKVKATLEAGKVLPLLVKLDKEDKEEEPGPAKKPLTEPAKEPVVVPPPSGGLPPRKTNHKDNAEMILIPAGEFKMGDNDMSDNPRHTVYLSSYYIYKNLVTVGMYEKFCQAIGRAMPPAPSFNSNWSKKDHPIVNVSWSDAQAYCAWAGVSLLTEAQWEKAARGTGGRQYPWGDEFDSNKLWSSAKSKREGTSRVGSFPSGASPYGVLDMAGNVWQWCLDWYDEDYTKGAPKQDPMGPGFGDKRVMRGAAWDFTDPVDFRSAYRGSATPAMFFIASGVPGYWFNTIGFRCASPGPR